MLLILIPIVWLAVVILFVAVCQASARGESAARSREEGPYRVREGLLVWERATALRLQAAHGRTHGRADAGRSRRMTRRGRPFALHGTR